MSVTALLLTVTAAVAHAAWNLAAKRVAGGGAAFVFLYFCVSALACFPFAAFLLARSGEVPRAGWFLAAAVSAVLHVVYGVVLQRGYAVGDMSVVYPLARGTGPLLVLVVAVTAFGERPGLWGTAGALLVVTGVFVLGRARSAGSRLRQPAAGIGYGVLTGGTIALYTLWDAYAVTVLAAPPVVYFASAAALQGALLAPVALRQRQRVAALWSGHRAQVLAVGLLSPLAYLLVLFAMRLAPVSLVAPVRELSIVLGGLFAWRVLGEADPARRVLGSAVVLLGIGAIAVA
ncbi:EamA family transporter [Haloechinothrix sp. YIM 98757]|uniref:EamA family transporter n=1 Tax=Haloechinothrix aidingensis TaxID=2752311 RepID=A0A838AAK0_9PSEU|nr:EamA family transporter [Haloechinothrix aidingensis]